MVFISILHNSMFILFAVLGFYILFKNKKARLNRSVFILMMFFSIWSLGLAFVQNPLSDYKTASFFLNLSSISINGYSIFIFLSLGFFSKKLKNNRFLFTFLAVYFLFFMFFEIFKDYTVISEKDKYGLWTVEIHYPILATVNTIIHNILVISGFIMLIFNMIKEKYYLKKQQSKIIFFTGFTSYFLSSANIYIPKFFENIDLPLFLDFCMLIFSIGMVYSIVKYKLFEISSLIVFEEIFDILPVGLIITDKNENIIKINQSITSITEKPITFFTNRKLKSVLKNFIKIDQFNFQEEFFSKQCKISIGNNEEKSVIFFYKHIIDNSFHKIGTISLFDNVDLLVKTQNQLQELNISLENQIIERTKELQIAKEKAEESEKLKSAFLKNISHEIRTPLNAICGFSSLLRNTDLTTEKKDEYISIINNSSNQLLAIVTDILTISLIEAKQENLNFQLFDINKTIENIELIFNQQNINNNIQLVCKKGLKKEEAKIISDKIKLSQILSNLLSNAFKFTKKGQIEFGYFKKNNYLEFYVRDTGIGIRKEVQDKIFESFRQAEYSLSRNYGGTGLGLSISKGLIELLGGKIWLESKVDFGTTFYFTIPYKTLLINETKKQEMKTLNFELILIVEDEDFNYMFLEELLNEHNIKQIRAKDGQEAIDICMSNTKIDLILMDIKIPKIDGFEAAKQIRKFRKLPIIAQTAYALESERKEFSTIFDDYIVKPIKTDDFFRTLEKFSKK